MKSKIAIFVIVFHLLIISMLFLDLRTRIVNVETTQENRIADEVISAKKMVFTDGASNSKYSISISNGMLVIAGKEDARLVTFYENNDSSVFKVSNGLNAFAVTLDLKSAMASVVGQDQGTIILFSAEGESAITLTGRSGASIKSRSIETEIVNISAPDGVRVGCLKYDAKEGGGALTLSDGSTLSKTISATK